MLNVIDHYYDKVSNEKLTKRDLDDIINTIDRTASFGSNTHSRFELYYKMAENPSADDDIIKKLIKQNIDGSFDDVPLTYKIIDKGSKKAFDELWDDSKPIKLWKSKHASSKQLKSIYSSLFVKDKTHIDKKWLQGEKEIFFKHPNAPKDILGRNLKNFDNLVAMASNPSLTSMPKVFEKVCGKAKIHMSLGMDSDKILGVLLKNKSLDWKTVAKGIDLVKQINTVFGKIKFSSDKRKELILEFCKHPDCPDQIKGPLYNQTKDEAFLPQAAKDIFMF